MVCVLEIRLKFFFDINIVDQVKGEKEEELPQQQVTNVKAYHIKHFDSLIPIENVLLSAGNNPPRSSINLDSYRKAGFHSENLLKGILLIFFHLGERT